MEQNKEWEKEFEELMPKTSTEGISYPQFCAVRELIRRLLTEQKKRVLAGISKIEEDIWSDTDPFYVIQRIEDLPELKVEE